MPEGKKCIIFVNSQKTVIRDKNGYIIKRVNSLLPNGHKGAREKGKTILQGVFYEKGHIVYITDVIIWRDELMIDSVAEYRLFLLQSKISDNTLIGTHLSEKNELMFRLPIVYSCTKESLQTVYYGCGGNGEISGLITHAATILNISFDVLSKKPAKELTAHFAYDNTKNPYLKDGIAFVRREGELSFGYSGDYFIWKDKLVSPYFDSIVAFPYIANLRCVSNDCFETQEGCLIKFASDQEFISGHAYTFSYESVEILGKEANLSAMKFVKKTSNKLFVSTIAQLVFKCIANTLGFDKLIEDIDLSPMTN